MEDFLWVEKYRPKTVADTILPDRYKEMFSEFVKQKNIPNLILSGRPGCGKTTIARAMLEELGCSYMIINGSLDGTKDTLRNEIKDFASSVSMKGGRKYIILDEADALTHHMQPALRNFMEEFSNNCGFILTCNYKHKIIEPLHSRCSLVEFNFTNSDKPIMLKAIFDRVLSILDGEKIVYDKKVIVEVLRKHFPDFRKIINELQKYSANGKIDSGILIDFDEISVKKLITAIKDKNFNEMRKWVSESDVDQNEVYRKLYDVGSKYLKTNSLPHLVMILAKYQYQAAFAVDPEINLTAALVECAIELTFI
jgi:DNA polymerase III delta prime subunit